MKKIVVLFTILTVFITTKAQEVVQMNRDDVPMSKEEMNLFAEDINDLLLANNYEAALFLYRENINRVNPKHLSLSDRQWWKQTVEELNEKQELFERNKNLYEQALRCYERFEYRKSNDLIKDATLDSNSVYREYIAPLQSLSDSLAGKRDLMERLDREMPEYIAQFKAKRFERLYHLLETEHITGYVAQEYENPLKEIIVTLKSRIKNDPVGVIMGNTELSEKLIFSICDNDVSKLIYILDLDVVHYFDLLFDTEAQKERYMKSAAYTEKLNELREIREKSLKSLYCQVEKVETGEYNESDGSFHIMIGSNKGVSLTYFNYASAAPAKAFGKRFEKVVHEALNVTSATDPAIVSEYQNGDKYLQHYLTVPVPKEIALKYENQKCRLVICFIPAGSKQYAFTGTEFYSAKGVYDVFDVKQNFPYSTSCRVILFSEDGEVIYDQIFL